MAETKKKYIEAVGRRKKAIARVRLFQKGKGEITVNEKTSNDFFPLFSLQEMLKGPFVAIGAEGKFDVSAKVTGGGIAGQAESVRLGIARALVKLDPELRTSLKKLGYLKRDPRVRERKKPGLKAARRAPQWSKR